MHIRTHSGLRSFALLAILLCAGFFAAPQVQANARVSIGVFQKALSPYGNWVNHPIYGPVWYPLNVAQDWRPYTDGYWAYTDEYGWLWVANEPWGWAPFHYGRWAWDDWYGWVWVPGQTWAPAWVFWRSGGGFAAWAPMPPNVVWQPGLGLNISYFNYDRDLRWDSWVSVRDVDLPHRHISRHIIPPSRNRQIINVTNYNQNITLRHNTIVNNGIPVKQIEQITRQPVIAVVPRVHDRLGRAAAEHDQRQPNIIRLPIATPTSDDLHQTEELARRLDGKRPDGTRTELPVAGLAHAPRAPGRLTGAPAPAPYATPEPQNPALAQPGGNTLPQVAIPQTPVIGLGLDSEPKHKGRRNTEERKSAPTAQLPSTNNVPIIPDQPQTVTAPVPATVSSGATVMPSEQNQSLEPIKQLDAQPFQTPVVTQPQTENFPDQQNRQHKEHGLGRNKEAQLPAATILPIIPAQPQADGFVAPARQAVSTDADIIPSAQNQSLESAKQPDVQPLQVPPVDQLQTENIQRQQEAARQQEVQNQQQMEVQQQQVIREHETAQQIQRQEAARQQEVQNQQQMEVQQQQVTREHETAQQAQQQEATRQQELQNQQQIEVQRQQAEREHETAQQTQQQEATRQQELQNQQQMEVQRQQAEHEHETAQQMQQQQQEAARQQELQNQQQMEVQRQQAERERETAQQVQQQEAARQQALQNQQQMEAQRQQAERDRKDAEQKLKVEGANVEPPH